MNEVEQAIAETQSELRALREVLNNVELKIRVRETWLEHLFKQQKAGRTRP